MQVRRLGPDDLDQARALGAEAFGAPPAGSTPPTTTPAGRHDWGALDDTGRLAAKLCTWTLASWWGGTQVATAGVAGVAVAAEQRGAGLLAPLAGAALRDAREHGAVISTLFPTAPGIYRGLGWEVVTSLDTVHLPTAELARIAPVPGVRVRRARPEDLPAVRATYDGWAARQAGPLVREGARWAERDRLLDQVGGVSLALDPDDRVVGAMTWDRERGYGRDGALVVRDLVATSLDAHRALWRVAGSFAPVAGRVEVSTSGADVARLVLPAATWDVAERHPYMLRVLDLPGAVAAMARALPGGGHTELDLVVTGDRLGLVDGGFHLTLGAVPRCEPAPVRDGAVRVGVQGLSLLVAGAQSCGTLRLLGLLDGPETHDGALDAAFGGRQLHVRDYF